MNLKDIKNPVIKKKLSLLQLGPSGTGKTHRALTAIEFGPMLILDLDGKYQDFISSGILSEKQVSNITCLNYDTSQEYINKIAELKKQGDKIEYATILFDTFSRWNELLKDEGEKKLGRGFQLQDWGNLRGFNINFFKNELFRLPRNVIVNCHLKDGVNFIGEKILLPGGQGSSGDMLPELVNECHYTVIDRTSGKRKAMGLPVGANVFAKTLRSDLLVGPFFKEDSLSIFKQFAFEFAALDKKN